MLVTVQSKNILFGMLASEDEVTEILRKLCNCLPMRTAQYPGRPECEALPL
jgi:hypothetical protein